MKYKGMKVFGPLPYSITVGEMMKKSPKRIFQKHFLLIILSLMLMGTNLYAYLDPGTGSYAIQIMIAFVLGAGFWAKSIIRRSIRFSNSKSFLNLPALILFLISDYIRRTLYYPSIKELLMTSCILIAISLIAYFALRKLIKNSDASITISIIGLFLVFYYTPILSFLGECARRVDGDSIVRHRIIIPMTIVLGTCLSLWALMNKKHSKSINAYFSLVFAALLIYNIFSIFGTGHKSNRGEAVQTRVEDIGSMAPVERISLGYKPDVYFILLDSYCSPSALRKYWHFDNSRFEDHLRERDFFIAEDSISAYQSTVLSLSSTLNMSSHDDQISRTDAFELIKQNSFTKKLIDDGYKFINLSIFDIWGNRKYYDPSIFNETAKLAERILMNSLIGVVKTRFIDAGKMINAQQLIVKELMDLPEREKEIQRPIFTYAHLLITHPPAFFDREGNRRTFSILDLADGYKQQIEYAGKVISLVIDRILTSSSRPPIIILQGDHGSRVGKKEWRQKEGFSMFNAIYLPKNDYARFSENISPPATLKLVAAQYLNEETPIR